MASRTWTGVSGGDWSDPTGWSGGAVPVAGDAVQLAQSLAGPYTVHLDADETAASLAISAADATLALYLGGLTLSISGATVLSAGGVAIAGNAVLGTGSFAETGGFLGLSDGTLAASGQATLSGGGLAVYGGVLQAAALALSGGSFGMSGGAARVANAVTLTSGTAGIYGGAFGAGSLAVSGGSLGMSGGSLSASGALSLSGAGSIGLYDAAATLRAGSFSQTGGTLGLSGGTVAISGTARFAGGTDLFYAGSTVTAGSLQVGAIGAAQTLAVNGAALSASATAAIAAGSTVSLYGGSVSAPGGIVVSGTLGGAGTVDGPVSGTGTLTASSGTLVLTGTVAAGLSYNVASGGTIRFDGTAIAGPGLAFSDVNQKLEVGPQGNVTFTTGVVQTSGTLQIDGGTLTFQQGFYGGAFNDVATGFGTVNGDWVGLGNGRGATITAQGGRLTLNGDIYEGNFPQVASGSTLAMLGQTRLSPTQPGPVLYRFLSDSSGTLVIGNASALKSFEANGVIGAMAVGSAPGAPTTVLDLASVLPASITSARVANGNAIELLNGATVTDRFALANAVGPAVVHWGSDGGTGTSVYLATR